MAQMVLAAHPHLALFLPLTTQLQTVVAAVAAHQELATAQMVQVAS
jgi:hypothetical protein